MDIYAKKIDNLAICLGYYCTIHRVVQQQQQHNFIQDGDPCKHMVPSMQCARLELTKVEIGLTLQLRVMFVTCLIFPISRRNAIICIILCRFSYVLLFSRFHLKLVWTQKCRRQCFFQKFSIQYFILNPNTLRFPCCGSFLGTKFVEEKPSEVRTVCFYKS